MNDLAQWLGAQLDEDERIARDPLCVNCGNRIVPLESPLGVTGYTHEGGWEGRRCPGRLVGAERVQNPALVLRTIEAKRQILARYVDAAKAVAELTAVRERLHAGGKDLLMTEMDLESAVHRRDTLHGVLRLLALPFADRPGFQESWRP